MGQALSALPKTRHGYSTPGLAALFLGVDNFDCLGKTLSLKEGGHGAFPRFKGVNCARLVDPGIALTGVDEGRVFSDFGRLVGGDGLGELWWGDAHHIDRFFESPNDPVGDESLGATGGPVQ